MRDFELAPAVWRVARAGAASFATDEAVDLLAIVLVWMRVRRRGERREIKKWVFCRSMAPTAAKDRRRMTTIEARERNSHRMTRELWIGSSEGWNAKRDNRGTEVKERATTIARG